MDKDNLPTSQELMIKSLVESIEKYCNKENTEPRTMSVHTDNYEMNIQIRFKGYYDKKINNPKELEYWKKVFPNKTDEELEIYRQKWGNDNPQYLKFKNL